MKMPAYAVAALSCLLVFVTGCASTQRDALFYPSHHAGSNGLSRWESEGRLIGWARETSHPETIWLMLHGNAGQATDRAYALPRFSAADSVFIVEYPGYGARPGAPSKTSFNAAAAGAYAILRAKFPGKAVCVVGESIGSGPASYLATLAQPPEKIVLVVPFDRLSSVAADHLSSSVPVRLIMKDNWDNVASLSGYRGPVEIFGAMDDQVIRVEHARNLAAQTPSARFHSIRGGHNDWSRDRSVRFRHP